MKMNIDTIEGEVNAPGVKFNIPNTTTVNVISEHGEVIKSYQNRTKLSGKDDLHSLQVRTLNFGNTLKIEGPYFAFLFGQNVFTASKPQLLVKKILTKVFKEYDFNIPEEMLNQFYSGKVQLNRVDIAVNYQFKSVEDLNNALTQIKRQLVESECTVKTFGKTVVVCPQKGREYSISFYAKGPQMRRIRKYVQMQWSDELLKECKNMLRVEIRVRAGLRKLGLNDLSKWVDGDTERLYQHYFDKLPDTVITSLSLKYNELSKLASRLKPVLALHKAGVDISKIYTKSTLYRHKRAFKQKGINLSKPNHSLQVIPLTEVLSLENAISEVPEWMRRVGIFPKRLKQVKPVKIK